MRRAHHLVEVCVDWDPTPCGSNPWDIGCCLAYADECDPSCDTGGGGGGGNQPPTISHTLTCSQTGNNNWCIGTLSLDLTATDPQNAEVVISGDVNGTAFACVTGVTNCSIPLSDGQGNINYKVDSSTGLSATGSTTYKKDSTTPQVNGNISGTNGLNSWYISSANVSASANDTTSGIAFFEMNINNTGYVNYSQTTFNDGINSIQYRAIDNAGNITETVIQEIKVDTVTPVINTSLTGTLGLNNWYTTNVKHSATSNDATSGISSFEVNVDNTGWVNYAETTFTDGLHSVQYKATDNAGNTSTTTTQQIKVDTTTPSLTINKTGTVGENGWYISNVSATPIANDTGSGIMSIEYNLNNGAFTAYTSPLQFLDGINTYQIKVTDNAGNSTTTPSLTLKVDTVPPTVNKDTNIKLGEELGYKLFDATSGLWIQRVVIEDEDEKYKKIVWLDIISGNETANGITWDGVFADGTQAPAGEYYIVFKITDQAGNETFHTTEVQVSALSFLIPIAPFTPPTTNTELPSSQQTNEQEENFGGTNNGNTATETTSESSGGEAVFAGLTVQAGALSESNGFNFGNENTSTTTTNSNILWGAVAAAAVGASLAEWQRQRKEEEARKQAEQSRGTSKGAKAKYEAMMKHKRIVGALQAEKDRERENAKTRQQERLDLIEEQAYLKHRVELDRQQHRIEQAQRIEEAKHQQANEIHRQGEKVSVPYQNTSVSSLWNTYVTPLTSNLSDQWNEFKNNIKSPSRDVGTLFNMPFANSPVVNSLTSFGSLIDFTLFNGKLTQTSLQVTQFANNLRNTLETFPAYNVINNTISFGTGAVLQYLNDNSFGLVDHFVNFENGSDAFQSGMEFGRTVSTIQGAVEIVVGLASAAFFLGSIPPTGAFTLGCAGATGGICLIPGTLAVSAELVMAGAGVAVSSHGLGVLNNNANNPLQIRGNGGGSSDITKTYGSNTGDTQKNADILRVNMRVGKTPGIQAHHIVPSTHPEAQKARQILENWGIDINQADNGVLLPKKIHDGLANDHTYMRAVLRDLEQATSKEDALRILQDIGERLLDGTYPRAGR